MPPRSAKAKLKLKNQDTPVGDDGLGFSGEMTIPTSPAIDPVANGARIVVSDSTGTVVDVSLPGGLVDPVTEIGWKPNKSATSWTYTNKAGLAGITKVIGEDVDQDAGAGQVQDHRQERRLPDRRRQRCRWRATFTLAPAGQCGAADFTGPLASCEFSSQAEYRQV